MKAVTKDEFIDFLKAQDNDFIQSIMGNQHINYRGDETDNWFFIHEGDIILDTEKWQPPGPYLVITGSIRSHGYVYAQTSDETFDEGGALYVLGDVECQHFAQGGGTMIAIGGNMKVAGLVMNASEDSALIVNGDFKCYFFYGQDIWVEAAGKIEMEYGVGYGLVRRKKTKAKKVNPKHDEATSVALLGYEEDSYLISIELQDKLSAGEIIFPAI